MDGQQPATPSANGRYEVHLEVFSGPMDLLLHLIERGDLDITLVSLAAVTGQYLRYVEALPEVDPDHLADFLVVAAKLLAIKAMVLIARPPETAEIAGDEGADLVRALREYQLFQKAVARLKLWEEQQRRCYPRLVPVAPIRIPAAEGLRLDDLVAALRSRPANVIPEPAAPAFDAPQYTVTVKDKIGDIVATLATGATVTFSDLLRPLAPPMEVIVTFLALLELLKGQRVRVAQTAIFGEIAISLSPGT